LRIDQSGVLEQVGYLSGRMVFKKPFRFLEAFGAVEKNFLGDFEGNFVIFDQAHDLGELVVELIVGALVAAAGWFLAWRACRLFWTSNVATTPSAKKIAPTAAFRKWG